MVGETAIAPPFLTSSYSFDAKGRLTELTHGSIASYSFTYDPVSRITAWTNPQGSGTFGYDDTDQLTGADYDYQDNENYSYDLNGNRTNDGYNALANNRLETDGIYNYEYDNEGNRIRRTAIATGEITEYTWDYRDRLTSVAISNSEGDVLSIVEYTYDVFDNRLSKQADTNADGELDIFEGYIYNGDHIYIVLEPDQFTYELDSAPSNGMVAIAPDGSFTYTPNEDFAGSDSFTYTETGLDGETETLTYTVDASTGEIVEGQLEPEEVILELPVQRYFYAPGVDWVLAEEAIAYTSEGITTEVEWALTDHLNSVTFVLDSTGAVLNAIAYDSFGNVTSETNPDVDFRFLYTGREFDPETGLYQYRARYYDAAIGQFLSEDPIGFDSGDVNLYRYVGNNPLVYVDPSGMVVETVWDLFSLGVGVLSFGFNLSQGNWKDAGLDAVGMAADLGAVLLPGIPGGAGAAIETTRFGGRAVDAANSLKVVQRGTQVVKGSQHLQTGIQALQVANFGINTYQAADSALQSVQAFQDGNHVGGTLNAVGAILSGAGVASSFNSSLTNAADLARKVNNGLSGLADDLGLALAGIQPKVPALAIAADGDFGAIARGVDGGDGLSSRPFFAAITDEGTSGPSRTITGETDATSIGKQVHRDLAEGRRGSGTFSTR